MTKQEFESQLNPNRMTKVQFRELTLGLIPYVWNETGLYRYITTLNKDTHKPIVLVKCVNTSTDGVIDGDSYHHFSCKLSSELEAAYLIFEERILYKLKAQDFQEKSAGYEPTDF